MTFYTVERQYMVPVYQHLVVEADSVEEACRKAIECDDWSTSKQDDDGARPTHVTAIREGAPADHDHERDGPCADGSDPDVYLLEGAGQHHPVPDEFAESDDRPNAPLRPAIAIVMDGGLIQAIIVAGEAPRDLIVVDYDTEGTTEPDSLFDVPPPLAGAWAAKAVISRPHLEADPDGFVAKVAALLDARDA